MYLQNDFEPGGFTSYLKIFSEHIDRTAVKIPGTMSYEEAAFMEPLACCLRGWKKLKTGPNDKVLIIGSGPIGLLFLQIARAFNAKEIFIADLVEYRLGMAKKLGADHVINSSNTDLKTKIMELTKNGGVNTIINTVGKDIVYQSTLDLLDRGGNYLFFAECVEDSKMTFSPNLIYKKELHLVGSYSSSPFEYESGLNLIHDKKINVKELITHMFSLKELEKGIKLAHEAKDSLKIMIIPKL